MPILLTSIQRNKHCDALDMDLSICGYYRISDDKKTATYSRSSCPIVENSKKQYYEQEENLKYYRCPLDKPCDLDYLFPEKITL